MSTILTRVQESVSRVDRTRALVMGILTGLAAFFALWKIFWLIFAAATLSGLGYFGSQKGPSRAALFGESGEN